MLGNQLQHLKCCAELQGLGTFLTLEELTSKDGSLLQQVQGLSSKHPFLHSCMLSCCLLTKTLDLSLKLLLP